jgi:integrase
MPESAKTPVCMKLPRFPYKAKSGSVTVRVYRLKRPATATHAARDVYQIAWMVGGARMVRQFANAKEALTEAQLKADQLAAGKLDAAASVSSDDVRLLKEANAIVGSTPLLSALKEWAKANAITSGHILQAAEAWARRTANLVEQVTVAEAVERFLAAKKKEGFATEDTQGSIYEALSKSDLGERTISSVTSKAIQAYLDAIPNRTSRNTHRKRIVTLWRWARGVDLLARDTQTEAERTTRAREDAQEIGIIDALTLQKWLGVVRAQAIADLPALVLSAFCGMRRSEVHGQTWEAINLEEGHLHVNAAKAGTPANRLVTLQPAAVEWLMLSANRKGPVCDGVAVDRVRKIGRGAGLALPENCTRHSFISYLVAKTKDIAATSLEAGNSPAIVRKHYLKLRTAAQAEEWFGVYPDGIRKPMTEAKGKEAASAS